MSKSVLALAVVALFATGCIKVNDEVITTGDLLNSAAHIYNEGKAATQQTISTAKEVKNSADQTLEEVNATLKELQEKKELLDKLLE